MDEMTDTQAAADPFATLEAQALQIEGENAPPPPPGTPEPMSVEDTARELESALQMLRMMVSPGFGWWQDFGQVWNDKTLQAMSVNGAAIMERHGWTMGQALAQWGPYIGLIGATLPPALVTYHAIQQRKAQARMPRPTPAPQPAGEGA